MQERYGLTTASLPPCSLALPPCSLALPPRSLALPPCSLALHLFAFISRFSGHYDSIHLSLLRPPPRDIFFRITLYKLELELFRRYKAVDMKRHNKRQWRGTSLKAVEMRRHYKRQWTLSFGRGHSVSTYPDEPDQYYQRRAGEWVDGSSISSTPDHTATTTTIV